MAKYMSKLDQSRLLEKCSNYLLDNFGRFSEKDKQKIAIALVGKSITQTSEVSQVSAVMVTKVEAEEVARASREALRDAYERYRAGLAEDAVDAVDAELGEVEVMERVN